MMTSADASYPFDHFDEAFAADPFPVYERMRTECPVAHSDAHGGFWVATRYDEIRRALLHPEQFSSRYNSVPKDLGFGDVVMPPMHLDPPEHSRMRRLLTPEFTPAKASSLEGRVRKVISEMLEELVPGGRFDASRDFARVLPASVICELLGVPDTVDMFTAWVERMIEHLVDNVEDAKAAGFEMFTFIIDLVAKRMAEPGPDLVSLLLAGEIDGDHLSHEEIAMSTAVLFIAGIDTTWRVLASSIHYLATHPEDQQELRDSPELIPSAREEFLRAFAPVSIARIATADVDLGGQLIRAGEMVFLPLPSGNRDELMFDRAGEVQLRREPNPHLAFGSGPHRCLGAAHARMELTVALEELLRIVPPFRLVDPDAITWVGGQVRGPRQVEIEFGA